MSALPARQLGSDWRVANLVLGVDSQTGFGSQRVRQVIEAERLSRPEADA